MRKSDQIAECERCGVGCKGRWCRACWSSDEARRIARERVEDETDEDLDAIIAEQLRCKPPWWEEETERLLAGEERERPAVATRRRNLVAPETKACILAELNNPARTLTHRQIAAKYGCTRGVIWALQKKRDARRREARCA